MSSVLLSMLRGKRIKAWCELIFVNDFCFGVLELLLDVGMENWI